MSSKDILYHKKIRKILVEHSSEALTPKKVRTYLAKELNLPPSELESIKTYISTVTASEVEQLNALKNNPLTRAKRQAARYISKAQSSPYFNFLNEYRVILKAQDPLLSMSALNEICLSKWKAMSEEEKNKYNTTIKQSNIQGGGSEIYDETKYIEHYLIRSGFHQFYEINSNQLIISFQDVTPKELYDVCTNRWNNLTKEQRIMYNNRSTVNVQDDAFESTIPPLPRSPYYVYLQSQKDEMIKLYPNNTLIDIEKIIFENWKRLDESKRQDYYLRSQQEQDQYPLTVTQWKYEFPEIQRRILKLKNCLNNYTEYHSDSMSRDECLHSWSLMTNTQRIKYSGDIKNLNLPYEDFLQSKVTFNPFVPLFVRFKDPHFINDREIW